MRFILEIELGNDAMQTYADVLGAFSESIRAFQRMDNASECEDKDGWSILDLNGNRVGYWRVEADKPANVYGRRTSRSA